jgi:hypothetical protein
LDVGGNPADPVAVGARNFLHFGGIHSYSSSPGDHRCFGQGHSRAEACFVDLLWFLRAMPSREHSYQAIRPRFGLKDNLALIKIGPQMWGRFGGREGIRTPGLLVANEEKSKLRRGATITQIF